MSTSLIQPGISLRSPSIPDGGEDTLVFDITESNARDHIKALSKVDNEADDRLETVDALCRAFYVVRKGLSTHPEVNAVRVRLTPREVAVLVAAHAARAQYHHCEGRHGSASVGEDHCSTLVQALLDVPQQFVEVIDE